MYVRHDMNQVKYLEEFASCWQRAVAIIVSDSVCHHGPLGSITTTREINQTNNSSVFQQSSLLLFHISLLQL
jgi:hypothetical protein